MNNPIQTMFEQYNVKNLNEAKNALREMSQNIILVGLSRTNFFDKISFYGGTSLRIFRGLDRFSEDLDFTLIGDASTINIDACLDSACNELNSYGLEASYVIKEKTASSNVVTAYIKYLINDALRLVDFPAKVSSIENMSIKIEIEHSWFDGAHCEYKALVWPGFAKVRCFDMPTLFASKLLAILQRSWKTRVKGRDYYDYMFYISSRTKLNMEFLQNGLRKSGYIKDTETIDIQTLKQLLIARFNEIDFDLAKEDVKPFVDNSRYEESFAKDLFILSVENLNIQ